MLKRLLAALAAAVAFSAFAADANTASQADLESIKGIGPATAARILEERGKGRFADWADLLHRVKGLGATRAGALSDQGLTVAGARYPASAPSAASR